MEIIPKDTEHELIMRLLSNIAYLLHWQGDFEVANNYAETSESIRHKLKDDYSYLGIKNHITLGHNYFSKENFNAAKDNYEIALMYAKQSEPIKLQAEIIIDIADALEYQGNYSCGLLPHYFIVSDVVHNEIQNDRDFSKAIELSTSIINSDNAISYEFILARAYKCRAYAYNGLGETSKAKYDIKKAKEISDSLNNNGALEYPHNSIDYLRLIDVEALIQINVGDYKGAIKLLNNSRKVYMSILEKRETVGMSLYRNLHALSIAYFYDGNFREAIKIAREILGVSSKDPVFNQVGDTPRRAVVSYNLALYYQKHNIKNDKIKAKIYFEKALEILKNGRL